jgi:RNA polymerase sigma factor (TIGR02999 family)
MNRPPASVTLGRMSDVTKLLDAAAAGDRQAAADLLPLVYNELRKLAVARMASESPGHTLDATALVNEVWLKLNTDSFSSKSGFFRAAAVAMRRILVDHARAKKAGKRGGGHRIDFDFDQLAQPERDAELDALDESLNRLALVHPQVAELVQLRFFAGLSIPEVAFVLGISPRSADDWWAYARGWLAEDLKKS